MCFVGIGTPSEACNLARLTHAPNISLIYESGTIGARPTVLPLSIGDGELAEHAITNVPVVEMFQYWLQGGHMTVGFLGAAQMDRYGNINTTVIGSYADPMVRLPGGGGAPEIADACREVFITLSHSPRTLVGSVDFTTSLGFGPSGRERRALGIATRGPTLVVTDLCTMRPEQESNELLVDTLHPGVERQDVTRATGWPIRFSRDVRESAPPNETELEVLRDLKMRTNRAHANERGSVSHENG